MQDELQNITITGLSSDQVLKLREQFGLNLLSRQRSARWWKIIWDVVREPMFLLLAIASSLYFILREPREGWMMLFAMAFVIAISVWQDFRSKRAIDALRELTTPTVKVVRDGQTVTVVPAELVPGDIVLLEEGVLVPADGVIITAHDLTVNESVLTGESLPVSKTASEKEGKLFQGTLIEAGNCLARITATGDRSVLGKIGRSMAAIETPPTLLQRQIGRFISVFAWFGLGAFLLIGLVNYFSSYNLVQSALNSLTLAMALIPEEIPVAFSSFMAIGAFQMSKRGIISRLPQTIENLGAVSVLCLDKTGTITQNIMEVHTLYDLRNDLLTEKQDFAKNAQLLRLAALASEDIPFDSMEKAIMMACAAVGISRLPDQWKQIHEYPLEGRPPMMTHVFSSPGKNVAVAKGAVEKIIAVCLSLTEQERIKVESIAEKLAAGGYRVLGICLADATEQYPKSQEAFAWQFSGLLGLYDPPKPNVVEVFSELAISKVKVKLLTGDNPQTAMTIATQCGIAHNGSFIIGDDIMKMDAGLLRKALDKVQIFARMFPDAKLKVIEALKQAGETVGMTGDGVNDGPALQASHIGIAMGKKGTETARQAADLVLTDDDISKIVTAIREGRKIFSNLKKGLRYIISIHIPIILTATIPLLARWQFPNVFQPIHIIFLELIMGPTCSIFFEKEPVEASLVSAAPRNRSEGFLLPGEWMTSILQGVVISLGVLVIYWHYMQAGAALPTVRSAVMVTLVMCNVFLTFSNRSFSASILTTLRYRNPLSLPVLMATLLFLAVIELVPTVRDLFGMTLLSGTQLLYCALIAFAAVMWIELWKFWKFRC